jgi:phosphoribosylaminoimidazole-succinocarboxamide synthase
LTAAALHTSSLHSLPLLARGKVRDNYAVGEHRMLMLATDRISAYDVVMAQAIPGKGALLTRMAQFWFDKLAHVCPNHVTGDDPCALVHADEVEQVRERAMVVQRLRPLPIEAVVRGYLAGSGWQSYQINGTVCGLTLPAGLPQASRLRDPIYTPATKAEAGAHDENISFAQTQRMVGEALAAQVRETALALYQEAAAYALTRGIIIADTKFEFGLDANDQLVLMDEVLTPDSSRYWPVEDHREGENPPSFDKQYLRDWLAQATVNGQPWGRCAPAPALPDEVVAQTAARYQEAWRRLC